IGAAPTYAPDSIQGWGKPNLKSIIQGSRDLGIFESQNPGGIGIGESENYTVSLENSSMLTVALAWTDKPASTLANTTLVNDLDLVVTDSQGAVYYPNGMASPDRLNTIEKTIIQNAQGNYTITVKYANGSDNRTQYGLAITAGSLTPGEQGLLGFAPREYYIGDSGNMIDMPAKAMNKTGNGNATLVFIAGSGANCTFGSAEMQTPQKKPFTPDSCGLVGPYFECSFSNLENGDYFADAQCAKGASSAAFGAGFSVFTGTPNYTISIAGGKYTNSRNVSAMALGTQDENLDCAFGTAPGGQILPGMGNSAIVALQGGDGEKAVYGSCIDDYGNAGATLNDTIMLDTQMPAVQAELASGGDRTMPYKASISAVANDSGGIANCTAQEAYENSTPYVFFTGNATDAQQNISVNFDMQLMGNEGNGTVAISCADMAGNLADPYLLNFTYDNSTPAITRFDIANAERPVRQGQNLSITVASANATYCAISIDGVMQNSTYPANGTFQYQMGNASDGAHAFSAVCFGENGKASQPRLAQAILDSTGPQIDVFAPLGGIYQSTPKIEFDAFDSYSDNLTCAVASDYGSLNSSVSGKTAVALDIGTAQNGAHSGTITCRDEAGNPTSANFTFSLNPLAPTLAIIIPGRYVNSENATFALAIDPTATLAMTELDGAQVDLGNGMGNATLPGLQAGYHTISAYAATAFGNITQSQGFYFDPGIPEITAINAPIANPESSLNISANATAYSIIALAGANGSRQTARAGPLGIANFAMTLAAPGENDFSMQATSATGAQGQMENFSIDYNTTVPATPEFYNYSNITDSQNALIGIMSANATTLAYWTDKYPNRTIIQGNGNFTAQVQLAEGPNA
ncbi:MAG TPA: hypothetical protein PLO51_01670, partial [Candidatus Micrarchaeota archaeon]|nr:hypothetical protein [Candidatus Micrarchaeota archaeon]